MAKKPDTKASSHRRSVRVDDVPDVPGLVVGPVDPAVATALAGTAPDEVVAEAARALAEYDFERAHHALRLAVRTSGGAEGPLVELAQFLVETYAQFDEAVTLLSSPAVPLERTRALRRLLADALFQTGEGAAALPHYEVLAAASPPCTEPGLWERLASLRELGGNPEGALGAYREAARLQPGNTRVATKVADLEEVVTQAATARVAQAEEAFAAGDTARAREILSEVLAGPGDRRAALLLANEIAAAEQANHAAAQRAAGQAALAAGDVETALDRFREVLGVVPDDSECLAAVARIETQMNQERYRDMLMRGIQAVAAERLEDAVLAFFRADAVRPEGARPRPDMPGRTLYDLVAEFRTDQGGRNIDRMAAALVAFHHAQQACAAGDLVAANTHVLAAVPLAGFRPFEALRDELRALARDRERARAEEAAREGHQFEAADAFAEAVAAYQRALAIAGGPVLDAEERLAAVSERMRRAEDLERFRTELFRMAAEGDWFALHRALDRAPLADPSDPTLLELRTLAEENLSAAYHIVVSPPPFPAAEDAGRVFDSRTAGLPDVDRRLFRVLSPPAGAPLIFLSGPLLVALDPVRMAVLTAAEVPEQTSFGERCEVVLAAAHPRGGTRLVQVSECEDEIFLFHLRDGALTVEDRFDLTPLMPQNRSRSARFYGLHGPTERIVQVTTPRTAHGPSVLRNLSLGDGRVVHEEKYGFALWHLLRYPGDDLFVVSRFPDYALRLRPGYFNIATMDHRGRIVTRFNLAPEEMPEPLESIHSLTRLRDLGWIYLTYDYYDPLGNVVRRSPAFLVLRPDGSVFYQSAQPERLLRDKRQPIGLVRAVAPPDAEPLVLLPHTTQDGGQGVTALGATDLKRRFEAELEPGETLHSLHEVDSGRTVVAVTFPSQDGAFRVRRLDPAAGAFPL